MLKEWLKKTRPHRRGLVAGVMSLLLLLLSQPSAPALAAALICGQTAHEHGPACYTPVLTCELAEHRHSAEDGCYALACGEAETAGHTHDGGCYALVCAEVETEGHTHDHGCYGEDGALVCGQEEAAGHTHSDACYELACGQEERDAHTHSSDCYDLICGQEETSGHAHSGACYDLTCGLTEHSHGEGCYTAELTCGQWEHIHTGDCYEPGDLPEEPDLPGSASDDPVPNAPPVLPEPAPNASPELPDGSCAGPDETEGSLNETGDGISIEPTVPADDPAFLAGQDDDETSYSVDVEWGAMTFWYVTQGWDPKRMRVDTSLTGWHVYDSRTDTLVLNDACEINAITVQNLSDRAELTAVFSYSGAYDFGIYEGRFTDVSGFDVGISETSVSLSPNGDRTVYFMPVTEPENGALPDRKHGPVRIGTISVDILPPPQTGEDGDDEGWID